MTVLAPTISAPTFSGLQRLAFKTGAQQVIFGESPFTIQKLEGLDKPAVRTGNVNWSGWPGASPGSRQLNTRKITMTFSVRPPFGSYSDLPGAFAALRAALSTEGVAEYPLWAQLPGFPLVCGQGSVIATAGFNWDALSDARQIITGASVQFECTDPYLYSAPTTSTTISLPGPAGGVTVNPLTLNLTFGGGSTPNTATITNTGDATCWPMSIIAGPCLNPTLSNTSITGNPTISTSIQLQAGDQLWIDHRLGSIMFYPSGSAVGTPSQYVLQPGSEFFGLPAGMSSIIAFNSADTSMVAGTLTVWSANTQSALL